MKREINQRLLMLKCIANDPVPFVAERRALVDAVISSQSGPASENLWRFQEQIDAISATAGTPRNAILKLLDEIVDRCNAMDALCENLNSIIAGTSDHSCK